MGKTRGNTRDRRIKERLIKAKQALLSIAIKSALGGHLFNLPPIYRENLDNSSLKYFCVKGGRGAVKSFSFTSKLIEESFKEEYQNCAFLFAREVMKSVEDSVYGLCKLLIRDAQLEHFFKFTQNKIVNTLTGVTFLFLGLRATGGKTQSSQLNRIKGKVAIKWIFVDEAQDLSAEVINVLFPTVNRGTNSGVINQPWHEERNIDVTDTRFLFAMNVHKPIDPIVAKLNTLKDSSKIIHVNIFDLPPEYQDKQLIEQAKAEEGEAYYPHVWLGEAFANFGGFPFMNHKFTQCDGNPVAYFAFLDPSFKGGDFTALSFLGEHPDHGAVAWGFCWRRAWFDCIDDIERVYKKFKPSKFYYEDNNLGSVPQNMLGNVGIPSIPKTSLINKESRIYKAAMYTSNMITFLESHSNSDYIENVRYYSDAADNDDGADAFASTIIQSGIIKDKIKW
jgi:hypothetical protein